MLDFELNMGTVAALGPGLDEYRIGQRVTVEVHAGCGQCKRSRQGLSGMVSEWR